MTQAIQNVSDTAFMVAGFRAAESARPQPLFRDPLAAKLAGEHGERILATVPRHFAGAWSVVIRTVIIDEIITAAIADGVDTVLNLGAGLDTRPYRMELPRHLRWVEVDYPHVIALKESRLAGEAPQCRLERVTLDLTDREARRCFLADASTRAGKVLVLTEGVAPYLTEADVADLARDLRREEKISYWIIDYFSPQALRYGEKLRAKFMRNAPFQFRPADWFGFFDGHGWRAREVRYIFEEGERLNRPVPLPWHVKFRLKLFAPFLSRERKEAMGRFAAYVCLVPK
jgi:methyltransferase (TIGR00027 family)